MGKYHVTNETVTLCKDCAPDDACLHVNNDIDDLFCCDCSVQIESLREAFDPQTIVVSISGGKDSAVLLAWAMEHYGASKVVAVHAKIDIDWKETLPIVRKQCAQYDVPLVVVEAIDKNGDQKGFLSQLVSPRIDRKTGEKKQYQFPDMANRWCTSILKTGPIDKYCRSLKGNVLVLIGERREESDKRKLLEAWRPDVKNCLKNGKRTIVKYSPLLDYDEKRIWKIIKDKNLPIHPCYSWGISRASCAICIFSSNAEIRLAQKHAPEIVSDYLEAEKKITHTFRYKPATKKREEMRITVADILKEGE